MSFEMRERLAAESSDELYKVAERDERYITVNTPQPWGVFSRRGTSTGWYILWRGNTKEECEAKLEEFKLRRAYRIMTEGTKAEGL